MKRLPSEFVSVPPSPRTPSVTRMPRTLGGHTIPVGWNWMHSMSMSSAPASSASRMPSPVHSQEFDVNFHDFPLPPAPGVAEVALRDEAGLGAVEQRPPLLQLEHPVGRLLGVELGHAPVVEHLDAAHGVADVYLSV